MPFGFPARKVELLDQTGGNLLAAVEKIYDRKSGRFAFPRNGPFWQIVEKAHKAGFRGQGQLIGIFDSGVDLTNPFLAQAVTESIDFTRSRQPVTGEGQDEHGHGTIVALLMRAIAPDAKIINVKVADRNGGGDERTLASALQWARGSGMTVANLSIGRYSVSWPSWALGSNVPWISLYARNRMLARALREGPGGATFLKRLNRHVFKRCVLCRGVDEHSLAGVPVCVSVGNSARYASCPARAWGAVAIGGSSIQRTAPTAEIGWQRMLADLPGFDQSKVVDLGIVEGFNVVPGSSMQAPMGTGLFALGMTRAEWRGDGRNYRDIVNLVGMANILLAAGNVAPAQALYLQALAANPHTTQHKGTSVLEECWLCSFFMKECFSNLGLTFLYASEFGTAERLIASAIRMAPWDPPAYLNMGALLRETGRNQEAVSAYRTALGLDPHNPTAHEGLGTTYERLGDRASAEQSYRQALTLNPKAQFAARFFAAKGRTP